MYWVTTPKWMRLWLGKNLIWEMPATAQPTVYLTFDDGPHPVATPFVLDQLKKYNVRATFFCIGKNIASFPELYQQTLAAGHATGNHTYNHCNGWETETSKYVDNVSMAASYINSRHFRPPYGRIRKAQVKALTQIKQPWNIVMWTVLSADFDTQVSGAQCVKNVIDNIKPGSIVVFHDSEKAFDRMQHALPKVLEHCKQQGWAVEKLF